MNRARAFGILRALAVVTLLVASTLLLSVGGISEASAHRPHTVQPLVTTNVSYVSSVDAWPLSYLETLPAGYAGAPAPLVVWLHGAGSSVANVSGGTGASGEPSGLIANASTFGYIDIAINTRSSAGYYLNTPCGGPQETDVLDAIANEEAAHTVTAVYFVGFSAGTAGAFSLAGNHKVTTAGIATSGTITDMAQTLVFVGLSSAHAKAFGADMCKVGNLANSPTVAGKLRYLDAFRYNPTNFSGVKLFVAGGALDTEAVNNYSKFAAYANVNSTFRTPTCNVATTLGQPANCTKAYDNLTGVSRWVDLYDSQMSHSAIDIPFGVLFNFWGPVRVGGFYTCAVSPPTAACVTPLSFAFQAFPTISHQVNSCTATGTNVGGTQNTPAGSSIYYFVAFQQTATSAPTVSTVTDTAADTFVKTKVALNAANARVELWIVNNTAGNAANAVTGTWSSTARSCVTTFVLAGTRNFASWNVLGAGTTGSNTTGMDGVTTTVARTLVLTAIAANKSANTFSPLGSERVIDQANSSTLFSAGFFAENQTVVGNALPQDTIANAQQWAALSVAVQAGGVPSAPVLSIASHNSTAVVLSWINPAGSHAIGLLNNTVYEQWGGCGNWTTVVSTFGVATGNSELNLPSGTKICFAVTVWNATGQSVLSNIVNVTTNGTAGGGGGGGGGGIGFAFTGTITIEDVLILIALGVAVATLIAVAWKD